MAMKIQSQELHKQLNGIRLVTANWCGSSQLFIMTFVKYGHQYNLLQKTGDKLSDNMLVNMLHTALVGSAHLEDVLNVYYSTRKGMGVADPYSISLAEYVE